MGGTLADAGLIGVLVRVAMTWIGFAGTIALIGLILDRITDERNDR